MKLKPKTLLATAVGTSLFTFFIYESIATCINRTGAFTDDLQSDCMTCDSQGNEVSTGATTCTGKTYSPSYTCGWDLMCGYEPRFVWVPGPEGYPIILNVNVAEATATGTCSQTGCTATVGSFGSPTSHPVYSGAKCL